MKSHVKVNCAGCPTLVDGVPNEDIKWLEERGLDLALACPQCTKYPEISLHEAEWLQEKRFGLGLTCRDCGDPFLIHPDEIVWLLEHDMKLFKRCYPCRQYNKEQKIAADQQVVEVATSDGE